MNQVKRTLKPAGPASADQARCSIAGQNGPAKGSSRPTACPLSVCSRVKKLKETLATVQQLDKNMSNLRSWLCGVEAELSRPVSYSVCHHQEIQRRLAEQQVNTWQTSVLSGLSPVSACPSRSFSGTSSSTRRAWSRC